MADKSHILTDQKLEEMEKRLSAIYSRAQSEIEKTADEYFSKFVKQDEAKRKLVEAGKITEDEYKRWRKGKVMYGKRFTEMKEQCAKQLLNVNKTALAYVNGKLPEVYAINYNALESAVNGIGGYSFTLVDADTIRNLATTDKSLLPYKAIDPAKDIPWNMKKINAETLQGILQGESMGKIAHRIRNVQNMNKTAAIRNARTMVTSAECKGRQDSYERAEKDGIKLQREWIAAIDGRTRHAHRLLDGQLADVDKPFKSELGDIMYPGDPEADPANVYNCRCTIAAKVMGFENKKQSLTQYPQNDIMKNGEAMYRRTTNSGAFSQFPERMSKKHIRDLAKEAGIDLEGITLNIEKSEDWLRSEFTGRADSEKIGGITFFPNAFSSKENLIRTIYHEKIHVDQFRKYGTTYVQNNRYEFELDAYNKEEAFVKVLKEKGIL